LALLVEMVVLELQAQLAELLQHTLVAAVLEALTLVQFLAMAVLAGVVLV
jgi:hypothetical protein